MNEKHPGQGLITVDLLDNKRLGAFNGTIEKLLQATDKWIKTLDVHNSRLLKGKLPSASSKM